MQLVRFVIAYDGDEYFGSQTQAGVPTVQETFEEGLQTLRAFASRTTFAGRTDKGVHAVGQVVSCDVIWPRDLKRLRHGLNGVLPDSIRVLRCDLAKPGFDARFDACQREYRYRVCTDRVIPPPYSRYVWGYGGIIDLNLAKTAASRITGTHSFGSFASAGLSQSVDSKKLRRTVTSSVWHSNDSPGFPLDSGSNCFELRIVANGFLPQMVRNIVRSVVDVASGIQSPEWIEYLLVSGDRRLLGPPAPPHGLVLWNVEYSVDSDTVRDIMG